ncbi:hypothetical protein FRC06_011079, partial [Ceratobasidium sp. 370]
YSAESAESAAIVLSIRLGLRQPDHHLTGIRLEPCSPILRMPAKLGHPPPTIPHSASRAFIEITTLLQHSPEPTTTLSGVVPGRALLDSPEPNEQETIEAENSQPRVPILTEKGSGYAEERKAFHIRSAKIRCTNTRKALEAQETGTPLKPRKPRKPRKTRKARKTRKSSPLCSTSYASDEYSTCSTMGTVTNMSTLQSRSHSPGCEAPGDCPAAASTSAAGDAGAGCHPGAGDIAPGERSHNGSCVWSPSAIPGTPGQDLEPGPDNLIEGVNPVSEESQH